MPDWFERNPTPNTPLTNRITEAERNFVRWGRTQFAANYARGGLSRTAFAPTRTEAALNPFRTMAKELWYGPGGGHGGYFQEQELYRMLEKYGDAGVSGERIEKALADVTRKPDKWKDLSKWGKTKRVGGWALGSRFLGPALTVGFAAHAAYAAADRGHGAAAKAFGTEIVGAAAGWGGMYAGASMGALAGSVLGPIGMAAGAAIGFFGGMIGGYVLGAGAFTGAVEFAEDLVNQRRQRRELNWVGSTAAFDTRRAYTMRQQSLQLMNRGMMTARSAMGREGVMLHQ